MSTLLTIVYAVPKTKCPKEKKLLLSLLTVFAKSKQIVY